MKKMFFQHPSDFDKLLPYYFAGVGHSYAQEHVKRPNQNAYLQWMFSDYQWIQTHKGSGELILNGNRYTLKKGQGMLIFPDEPHEYYALDDEWETDWIILKGKFLEDFISNILKVNTSTVYYISDPAVISNKIGKLYNCAISPEPTKNISCSTIVYQILMDIFKLTSQKQNTALINKSEKIEPVLLYIHNNYDKQISLIELAEILDVTPQHLCRIFKKTTSHTVSDYINMVRIQKSKELLLADKKMQIKEVALTVGFNNVSYFCYVFNKSEHITPVEFRTFNGY